MRNARDKIIYVGKAKSLRARVKSYFLNSADHSLKTKYLMMNIKNVEYILTKTEVEAFLLEASLIKKHRPRYNIRLKDDKAYPYIKVAMDHVFPRLYISRRVQSDGGIYFGPYSSGLSVRETIRFLNKTFKIRDCTDSFFATRSRPCISYQIGHCSGPCVKLVNGEEYGIDVQGAVGFLKGRNGSVIKELTAKMKEAAKEERFEAAARLRDSLQAIERIWESQTVVAMEKDYDQDVIGFVGDERGTMIETLHIRGGRMIGSRPHFLNKFNGTSDKEEVKDWLTSFLNQYYSENIIPDEIILQVDLGFDIIKLLQAVFIERQGKKAKVVAATGVEGRKLMDLALTNAQSHFNDAVTKADLQLKGMEQIKEKLGLPTLPRRIECYDISNFQGKDNVASQVVFEEGLPRKSEYRRYKIKTVIGSNDFAAMKEVLERRFKHAEYDDPDLVVVDGGKGQLSMAVQALREVGRPDQPVVGLAKARVQGEFSDAEVLATQERFFIPGRQNPVTFPPGSEAFQILVGIRDEAHRFAIGYHRKLRGNATLASVLDEINGLGEKRKKNLLKTFGSVEAIGNADVETLASIPGMNKIVAQRVLLHLKGDDGTETADPSEESIAADDLTPDGGGGGETGEA